MSFAPFEKGRGYLTLAAKIKFEGACWIEVIR
jgi:hypothetical protein